MSASLAEVGVIGLGVMGAGLARNLASRGHRVAVYARRVEAAVALSRTHPEARLEPVESPGALVGRLARPRRILLLVPAGGPVDEVLGALDPLLDAQDVVIDAGNSHFSDTDRRMARAAARPWRFVGMGVSGGEEGALHGPALMPGGDPSAWPVLRPLLESIAAVSDAGPCVGWCGNGSAGHFVKMVHNGIEYGDMQLIAEIATLLRHGLGLAPEEIARTFAAWNASELGSFLLEISADIFRTPDPEKGPHSLLLDAIEDRAEQKGTGRWTVQAALELGVAVPTIAAAVDARILSAAKDLRLEAEAAFGSPRRTRAEGIDSEALREALYASRIATYVQGFGLLAAASAEHAYGTSLAEVARIWSAGCIIRARLLDPVRRALAETPAPPLLLLASDLRAALVARLPAWRRVVAASTRAGFAIPALAAALNWLEMLTTGRGSAALIQAQRDYFGRHGYERAGRPGVVAHAEWPRIRSKL